jgi:hypothetical protein
MLAAAGNSAAAEPLSAIVPGLAGVNLARILSGESLVLDASESRVLAMLPATPEAARIGKAASELKPAFLVESLYLARGIRVDDRLALFNALTAVRTMSGLTYFSFNRNKETVLYSDVYRTGAPGSTKALPDVVARELPEKSRFDIHIRDVNFGSTWYGLNVDMRGGGFEMDMVNTKPIGLVIVRAFDRDALRTRFTIAQADEGAVIYGICMADPAPAAARLVDMYWAVAKRLDAVRQWAVGRLEGMR